MPLKISGIGEMYWFTTGGKIYIDSRVVSVETPIHEQVLIHARPNLNQPLELS